LELIEKEKVSPQCTQTLTENYEKMLNNKKFSDFSFVCSDGVTVNAHKCIIASQCPTFETMLDANMEESESSKVLVDDIDSETMLELLRFIYCRKVNNIPKVNDKLLIAANKYGVEELVPLCASSLMDHLDVDNIMETLALADLVGEDHLKNNCIDFIKW
jgi:speckle-type POZ protein